MTRCPPVLGFRTISSVSPSWAACSSVPMTRSAARMVAPIVEKPAIEVRRLSSARLGSSKLNTTWVRSIASPPKAILFIPILGRTARQCLGSWKSCQEELAKRDPLVNLQDGGKVGEQRWPKSLIFESPRGLFLRIVALNEDRTESNARLATDRGPFCSI